MTGISDISEEEVSVIFSLARDSRSAFRRIDKSPLVTLMFLAPSTRTFLGFAAATARLGGSAPHLGMVRQTGDGLPSETLADTLRVASGMSDVVVCRPSRNVQIQDLIPIAQCPLVNGGDSREHPTQALIDLFAISTFVGPSSELHIGISGDLHGRATRSLIELLAMRPPRRLSLFAPPGRGLSIADLPARLRGVAASPEEPDFSELDILLLSGLAPSPGTVPLAADAHLKWGFSPLSSRSLPGSAVVLSPGPVIDEIDPVMAGDSRLRVFEQSDLGVAVRIAVLRWLLQEEL